MRVYRMVGLMCVCVVGAIVGLSVVGCGAGEKDTDGFAGGVVISDVDALATLMEGEFSSARQSVEEEGYLPIEVRVGRVDRWSGDGDIYLYMEQALSGNAPYRQRVYRISEDENGAVTSTVLWLPGDVSRFEGAWRDPGLLAGIGVDELEDRGCVVEIRRASSTEGWVFEGETRGMGCPSDFRGAVRATSRVRFARDRFSVWDRGWDPRDVQVWGPTDGPYVFERVDD